jgi:hypothetical protein
LLAGKVDSYRGAKTAFATTKCRFGKENLVDLHGRPSLVDDAEQQTVGGYLLRA